MKKALFWGLSMAIIFGAGFLAVNTAKAQDTLSPIITDVIINSSAVTI